MTPEAKAPPYASSTVAAPPSSSNLAAGTTRAPSWFAILAVAMIDALPGFLLLMEGELPFYIATAVGLFVAASVVWAGWCYPKNELYQTFMRMHVFIGSFLVYFPSTFMLLKISSPKLDWMLLGLMSILLLASYIHDNIVDLEFKLGEQVVMFVGVLVGQQCGRCKEFVEAMVLYSTPVLAVGLAVIFVYALMK